MTSPAPIYLDFNGTTPLAESVKQTIIDTLGVFGNPSSSHWAGKKAKEVVDRARKNVGEMICSANAMEEITFTSGGTESNNMAIIGTCLRQRRLDKQRNVIVTSTIEHPAVNGPCEYLQSHHQFQVIYVPVDKVGFLLLEEYKKAVALHASNIALVTIMHSNNEIGSIQPIREICAIAKAASKEIVVHTDCSQSLGKVDVDVNELGVDLLTICGHKLYCPKGVGALYIRKGIELDVVFNFGASQESGKRAGTESTVLIAALGEAARLIADRNQSKEKHATMLRLRELLWDELCNKIGDDKSVLRRTSAKENCLVNVLSVSFKNVISQDLLTGLKDVVACSAGAACHDTGNDGTAGINTNSNKKRKIVKISKVIEAIGVEEEFAAGTIRFSLGNTTTDSDIHRAVHAFVNEYHKLINLSSSSCYSLF